jgi:CheY-like chemotaxis protein
LCALLQLSEGVLERDREQREAFTKGMSNYYEQVRVCGVCYGMYTCLDWARDIFGRGDAYGAGIEGMGAAHPKSAKSKSGRGPRQRLADADGATAGGLLLETSGEFAGGSLQLDGHSRDLSPGKLPQLSLPSYASATTASAVSAALVKPHRSASQSTLGGSNPFGSAPGSPGGRTRPRLSREEDRKAPGTWKSHVATQREHDNVQGAKFVALDDYLRGGTEALADRKNRERERQAKQRNALGGGSSLLDSVHTLPRIGSPTLQGASVSTTLNPALVYRGKVLLACEDNEHAQEARNILEDASFEVHWVQDGRKAINDFILYKAGYDCVLVQKSLPLQDAFQVVHQVRREESTRRKEAAAFATSQGKGIQPPTRRHPVICYTNETSPEDLRAYMKADMDGCVSYPVNKLSLLNTVRAAVPQHLAKLTSAELREAEEAELRLAQSQIQTKVMRQGALGELEGSQDSASMALKTLPIGQSAEDDIAFNGIVQIDADTRVPFMVLDSSRNAKVSLNANRPYFNLVVVHDLFDTAEKMKIFLRPMVQRYMGLQVLLWNYPGQAFTEWREEQLLNNEYHATCLNEVLGQVGEKGTRDFDTSRPFYIMGFGNGANIAAFYASHFRVPNLRGMISINGWAFVDSYLAGIMHDCINIFTCAPPSRPDLPVYFFSRFLFCKDYLARVSVPLALNIYTAVHNSISIKGRLNLCKGVLQSVDVRSLLKEIDCPMICIHSTQDALSRPLHTEPYIAKRAGEVRSIHKVLQNPRKTCVIWMKGGHEVFQENKKPLQQILEQILTGFHENHDVAFPTAAQVDSTSAAQGRVVSNNPWENTHGNQKPGSSGAVAGKSSADKTVEDHFIDNVLGSINRLNSASSPTRHVGGGRPGSSGGTAKKGGAGGSLASVAGLAHSQSTSVLPNKHAGPGANNTGARAMSPPRSRPGTDHGRGVASLNGESLVFNAADPNAWSQYSQVLSENIAHNTSAAEAGHKKKISGRNRGPDPSGRVIDPTSSLFERQDNVVYGARALEMKKQQDVHDFPEVKEYMGWRLKRNKKRLQRLQAAARCIQGAFRAFVARRLVQGIRRLKACLLIQRVFRGWLGRCSFKNRARNIWASQIIQRAFRGYMARKWYFFMRLKIAAAANIQRLFRGHRARARVNALKLCRYQAASVIQAMFRRYDARRLVWRMRQFRNCSTAIQRVFRGHLGRAKATAERDKYIFSRSQSQGIEFGRQMLLEHKLHATRLQSDVTLLTQEKVAAEEQIEALLEEISTFEEGVRTLEKEMHQLSKVESEASAFMDEDSKFELREQKMKLDREFGEMLGRISNRKDMLDDLERKLSTIDKSRQAKEEQLRTLERKLVVLLEEQQNELAAIKRKQDVRGAMLAASHDELMRASGGTAGGNRPNTSTAGGGGGAGAMTVGGGGGHSGPSLQEKKQAAQLMQSTETLMKFGFMSMSMTYFQSLNMIKALRTVSAQDTVMAALADVHAQRAVGYSAPGGSAAGGASMGGGTDDGVRKAPFLPDLKAGQLPGQQLLRVSAWSVEDVAKWLQVGPFVSYGEILYVLQCVCSVWSFCFDALCSANHVSCQLLNAVSNAVH